MKITRTLTLIAATALLLTACNQESDEAAAVKENTNPLLAYVPADTVYVFAALEPTPKHITDAYIDRFQPVFDVISKQIAQFQIDYESGNYEDNQMASLATAVLDELGGSLSSENLGKLGITMQAHHAFYAMGVFPVIRLGLSDAQELRNAIGRIEAKMGFELPVKELNGSSYWHLAEDGMPVGVYIAILDQQLAISIFPPNAENSLLASFLGQEMPTPSMASTNALAIMNSEKGYSNYGSGILDLQKLSDEILNADSATHAYLGPDVNLDFDPASMDAVCITEINSIVEKAPRMTAGTTKLSANEIAMRYELEIENSLAGSLAALVSDTPVASDADYLLSGSLALQVGRLRSFVLEQVNAIVTSPYQCEMFQELNQNATELVTQLNTPMPPMVNNLMGARVRLNDFDPVGEFPQGEGLLAVHVDKPEMFVGMASMMLPGFDSLDLANQSEPVRIPPELLHMEGLDVFAMMSDDAIGASIGKQQAGALAEFMAAPSQDGGTFFSVSYDMARQMEIQTAVSENLDVDQDDDHLNADELTEAIRQSYTAMLGRSRVDMQFTGNGLIIDSEISFK